MRFCFLLVIAVSIHRVAAATPPTDLMFGHYEIHVDYTPTPGDPDAGWRFSVSYDQDDDFSTSAGVVRLDPETTTIVASPKTATAVPSPAGVFGRFGPSGTPLWVLPQNQIAGTPFLGVRTTMAAGLFQARVGNNYTPSSQGSVSLKLSSVEGSGPDRGGKFATWKSESFGTTVFSFDTTDGISSADEIPTIPVSSHTHYNWGLTKPGLYRVTFEAQGKLMPSQGNVITSARKTFLFSVPFSSRIGVGVAVRPFISGSETLVMSVADPIRGVAYAADQAMVEASQVNDGRWELPVILATGPQEFRDGVGISPEMVSAGLPIEGWSDFAWEISEIRGPGAMTLSENGNVLTGAIALQPRTSRNLLSTFDEAGIYRVTGILSGTKNGGSVRSQPVTLVFGAGVTAEFDYAAWQASFEKTAGLPAGALVDPMADRDDDGLANAVEFAFFWHGLDPTRPDGQRMPGAFSTSEGFGAIDFLRDTFKDPLDESRWRIEPSVSNDLINWSRRSSRNPGFPQEIFEVSTGSGNATGRIMKRQLRIMPTPQPRAFFRFHITSPSN